MLGCVCVASMSRPRKAFFLASESASESLLFLDEPKFDAGVAVVVAVAVPFPGGNDCESGEEECTAMVVERGETEEEEEDGDDDDEDEEDEKEFSLRCPLGLLGDVSDNEYGDTVRNVKRPLSRVPERTGIAAKIELTCDLKKKKSVCVLTVDDVHIFFVLVVT